MIHSLHSDTDTQLNTRIPELAPPLVFIHLPKCAGTSVRTAILQAFDLSSEMVINPIAARKAAEAIIDAPTPEEFFAVYPRYQEFLLMFLLSEGRSFITGHLPISETILDMFEGRYLFATILRDPVERWVSHYVFNKLSNHDSMVLPCLDYRGDPSDELRDTLGSWRGWQLAHLYTVLLGGSCPSPNAVMPVVDSAIQNLRRFKILGTSEELPRFCDRFRDIYKVELKIERLNRTADLPVPQVKLQAVRGLFTRDILSQIRRLCADDYLIYREAVSLADRLAKEGLSCG